MKLKSFLHSLIKTSVVSLLCIVFNFLTSPLKANDLNSLPIEVQDYLSKQNIIVNQTIPVGYFFIPLNDLEVVYDRKKVNLDSTGLTYTFSNKKFIKFFIFHVDKSVMDSLKSKYTYIDGTSSTYYALRMNSKNQIIWKTNEDVVKPRLISTEIQNPDISIKLVRGKNAGLSFGVKLLN